MPQLKKANDMIRLDIVLERVAKRETYTIGKLYIDGEYFCDTLEDKVRPEGEKVFGETAIPAGTYRVIMSYSNKFKRVLPLLLKVPMFEGIRLHAGNSKKDTHGCPLVGKNTEFGKLTQSKKYETQLNAIISKAIKSGKFCFISIR